MVEGSWSTRARRRRQRHVYTDYGSYAEIAVNAVGNTAEMPAPGVLSQLIAKSGGNTYHGTLYADYENDSWSRTTSTRADRGGRDRQHVVAAVDTNRLTSSATSTSMPADS